MRLLKIKAMEYDEKDAWKEYESKSYKNAEKIWLKLIENSDSEEDKNNKLLGYGYTLVGLNKFDKAREIYNNLYEKTKHHIYLHQLGMIERENNNYFKALEYIEREEKLIDKNNNLSVSVNLYEKAKINELLGNLELANKIAKKCLLKSLKTEDKISQACAYRLIGDIKLKLNKFNDSIKNYDISLKKFDEAGDKIGKLEIEEKLSIIRKNLLTKKQNKLT